MVYLRSLILCILFLCTLSARSQSANWDRLPGADWLSVHRVYFLNNDTGFVEESGDHRRIFFTFDGGQTWERIDDLNGHDSPCIRSSNRDILAYRVAGSYPSPDGVWFVGIEYRELCSYWGYSSFLFNVGFGPGPKSLIRFPDSRVDTLEVVSPAVMFASSPQYMHNTDVGPIVLRTIDSGKSWSVLTPAKDSNYDATLTRFQSADTGIVACMYWVRGLGAGYDYYWTSDGGRTWRLDHRPPTNTYRFDGPFYGNNGYWYEERMDTLWYTQDLGITWRVATIPPVPSPPIRGDSFYTALEGYSRSFTDSTRTTLLFTSDGGSNWKALDELPAVITHIAAPSSAVAYAVGGNGVIYKTKNGGGRILGVTAGLVPRMTARIDRGELICEGLTTGERVDVYDMLGRTVCRFTAEGSIVRKPMDIGGAPLFIRHRNWLLKIRPVRP